MDKDFEEELEKQRQFLARNPRYAQQCFIAWKLGDDNLKKFRQNDDEVVGYINRDFFFLSALFELPGFET